MGHMPPRFVRSLLLSIVFVWAVRLPGVAQHMNAAGVPCNIPSTTAAEATCFGKEAQIADRDLNATYARMQAVLSPQEKNDLVEAQRAWLKYRDLTCAAEYHLYGGGTGGPVTRSACLAAVTHQRVTELKTIYGWRLEK